MMVKKKTKKSSKTAKSNIKKAVESVSRISILELVAVGALGIILILNPNEVMKFLAYAIAGFLIIKGLYRVTNYFMMDGEHDFYNNDLFYGMLALLSGILVLLLSPEVASLFRIIVGVWMMYAALIRMNTAVKLWAAKVSSWMYVLLMALVMLAVGLYVLLNSGALVVVVGWMMLGVSILGIINEKILLKHLDEAF